MRRPPGRDKGSLVKYVEVRDDDLLYRQFAAGAEGNLTESLERAYEELKLCRSEAQSAFNHYTIILIALASVQVGVIELIEAMGATIDDKSILYVLLVASGLLSLRYAYVQTRVSFLRAIFEAHCKRLSPAQLANWIARHPLGHMSLSLYSTVFRWPKYLVPEHKRMIFELVHVLLIALGAMFSAIVILVVIISACVSILRESHYNWLSITVVSASMLMYVGSGFFPKFGSRKRTYRHTGLLALLAKLDDNSERKKRAYSRIAKAQINFGG